MSIRDILHDSEYDLDVFPNEYVIDLEHKIVERQTAKRVDAYLLCAVRNKLIKATPEEIIRQLYIRVLNEALGYPINRISVEYEVSFGREKKRADVVVFDKTHVTSPYIIVELKKPKFKEGKEQLKSYCNATGAPIGVWCNGGNIYYYHRKDPNYFEDLGCIPNANQKLSDLISERWKWADLVKRDKLVNDRKSLKDLILEMEDEVLANAGVDVFEEVFKLIFTKLYDEMESGRKPDRNLEFRNYGDTDAELKERLQSLFDKAKDRWDGVFSEDSRISLTPSHLSVCVASLQDVKLFNSNLEVVDEAFEYLIKKNSKEEKGQYFTPRYIIDMCVRMLNPTEEEAMIDTAAGSCGFPVHTIFYVWQQILKRMGIDDNNELTTREKPAECIDYVREKVFAIDFDERAVRVARTLNLIAGDGQTNVLHLNTLEYDNWDEKVKDEAWFETYNKGWKKFRKFRAVKTENRDFQFDIVMANPPFAGDVKESRILSKYDLSRNVVFEKIKLIPPGVSVIPKEPTFPESLNASQETVFMAGDGTFRKIKLKQSATMSRDILFVERNIDFLKPGGRMAIVLPQGRLNNSSDRYLREYIADRCRILAVIGLHGNVFKPHTGTKTSVLLLQKWDDTLCPKVEDYNIFFATMNEPSKDNSGNKIYRNSVVIKYYEHNKLSEYTEDDFNYKYGSLEKATLWAEISEYERHLDLMASANDNENDMLLALKFIIDGDEYNRLSKKERMRYTNIKRPIIENRPMLDSHGHLIVKHDLFNHDGLTEDGIAEAFIEFAKKERLSFFVDAPFNKARYEPLKGGHEISEVTFSTLNDIIDYRIEAEYFQKKFLRNEKVNQNIDYRLFKDCFKYENGRPYNSKSFKSLQGYEDLGPQDYKIPVAKIGDVTNKRDIDDWDILSEHEFNLQGGKTLEEGDILMTLTGDPPDVGKVSVCCNLQKQATWNQRVARISIKDRNRIYDYAYAYAALSTPFCRTQLERYAKGIRQRNLGNEGLDILKVPILPMSKQRVISEHVKNAINSQIQSKKLYCQAEALLVDTIGRGYNKPEKRTYSVQSYKNSFESSGRLDSEYYQMKYYQLFDNLSQHDTARLGDLVDIKKSIEPGSDAYVENGIPFVRVADLSKFGLSKSAVYLDEEDYGATTRPKKDTILLSKDGSVGIAYKLEADMDIITSSAILHLTVKDRRITPEYLGIVLNSQLVAMQAERDAGGSVILHWKISEIENVVIPILPIDLQLKITLMVNHSVELRRVGSTLMQEAVKIVEEELQP